MRDLGREREIERENYGGGWGTMLDIEVREGEARLSQILGKKQPYCVGHLRSLALKIIEIKNPIGNRYC